MSETLVKTAVVKRMLLALVFTVLALWQPTASGQNGTWVAKTPMRKARVSLGVGVVNGNIFAIGGMDRKLVSLTHVKTLVLDEADRMLDMGFLPAIRRIVSVLPKERQTLCFSATMDGAIAQLVRDYTRNPVRLSFGSTLKPSENVRLQAFEVADGEKPELLYRLLNKENGRCLIFSRTKRGTERIAKGLNRQGINAAMIHGDRSQSQRTAALTGFQRGQHRVLVATDVAARGIHVQDIAQCH